MHRIVLSCAVAVVSVLQPAKEDSGAYGFTEVMIPMRDGIGLQTVIVAPNGVHAPLPILLRRTPYGVPTKAFDAVPEDLKALAADG